MANPISPEQITAMQQAFLTWLQATQNQLAAEAANNKAHDAWQAAQNDIDLGATPYTRPLLPAKAWAVVNQLNTARDAAQDALAKAGAAASVANDTANQAYQTMLNLQIEARSGAVTVGT